jgi:hypothetical protein
LLIIFATLSLSIRFSAFHFHFHIAIIADDWYVFIFSIFDRYFLSSFDIDLFSLGWHIFIRALIFSDDSFIAIIFADIEFHWYFDEFSAELTADGWFSLIFDDIFRSTLLSYIIIIFMPLISWCFRHWDYFFDRWYFDFIDIADIISLFSLYFHFHYFSFASFSFSSPLPASRHLSFIFFVRLMPA